MKYKQVKTKYIFLIIIAIFLIVLAIFSSTLKEDRKLNKFESLIKDTVISIENIVTYPFKYIIDKIDDYNELLDIKEKYNDLLLSTERVYSLNTENIELRKQLESLKEELDINYTINGYSYLNATVTTRNVSSWYNTITINKGTYNGVEEGMAVVNSKGLIGKVISTTTFNSEVKLLTTNTTNNKISVAITNGKNKVYGVLTTYDYKDNYLTVEGISNNPKIDIGDYVYTSGLGGIFPSGILIGTVKVIEKDEYDLAEVLKIEPIVNFEDINYVAILKRNNDK